MGPQDQLPQGASEGNFNLEPMETVRLRRIETMAELPLARSTRGQLQILRNFLREVGHEARSPADMGHGQNQ